MSPGFLWRQALHFAFFFCAVILFPVFLSRRQHVLQNLTEENLDWAKGRSTVGQSWGRPTVVRRVGVQTQEKKFVNFEAQNLRVINPENVSGLNLKHL